MNDRYKPGKSMLGQLLFIALSILLVALITFFVLIYPNILQSIFGTPTPTGIPIFVP